MLDLNTMLKERIQDYRDDLGRYERGERRLVRDDKDVTAAEIADLKRLIASAEAALAA